MPGLPKMPTSLLGKVTESTTVSTSRLLISKGLLGDELARLGQPRAHRARIFSML